MENAARRYKNYGKRIADHWSFDKHLQSWKEEIKQVYTIAIYDHMSVDNYVKMMRAIEKDAGKPERIFRGIQSAQFGPSFQVLSARTLIMEMRKSGS